MVEIEKIRLKLSSVVKDLCEIDPYWNKCFPCQNKGRCCIGSDVDVSEEEWKQIFEFLKDKPDIIQYAKARLRQGKPCIFYCSKVSKCLIHDLRPIMCRYTPFQVIENDGKFFCNNVDEKCVSIRSVQSDSFVRAAKPFIVNVKDCNYIFINEISEIKEYKKKKIDFLSTKFYKSFVEQ